MRPLLFLLTWLPAVAAQSMYGSMYADPKAARPGDVLTVVLAERTAAQRQSNYQAASQGAMGGNATLGGTLAGRFGVDAQFTNQNQANNQTAQSDLLSGTITALVVGVDSLSGNLQVAGERRLNVNGVTHLMRVSGVVRPRDIRYDNTVLSFQIANAEVVYKQDGLAHRFFSPGGLVRLGVLALLGGALVFGATQAGE